MSIDPIQLSCIDKTTMYEAGPNIISVMQEISKKGKITGIVHIDEYGRRQYFNIKILNFQQSGVIQMGYWDFDGIHVTQIKEEKDIYLQRFIEEKIFKISIIIKAPYIMEITNGSTRGELIDGKRYEGFCIDLIHHIANILRFKGVVFQFVTDGYGSYDPQTKTWHGLIGSILNHEADLAISDLTITSFRKSVVDFSLPFMTWGYSIVFSKPEKKTPPFFPFLLPLSTEVWLYIVTAYLVVSITLFILARMAPDEWNNPHHLCNADPETLENNFNFKNSFFLTIGSFMQRHTNILPKASSLRMLASMWWFFTLIIYSSYTANLAAFFTIDKLDIPIKGFEDLPKQTKIKYGAIRGGLTATFFQNSNYSTYKQIWAAMANFKPSVFTLSHEEGINRVLNSKRQYAFLMESAAIEYNTERKCNLIQIGNMVGNRGYSIAMPRNETHKTVRPINVRQLWTLKRHDKRMHCFCEFFRDGKLVHGRPVLKWAMFRITVGSIQRTVVFYTHSGPTGRMFYPRSTVESETGSQVDKSLKPGPVGVTLRVIREHNLNALISGSFGSIYIGLEQKNTRRLPHERKHAGQRPERGHADSRCNSSETLARPLVLSRAVVCRLSASGTNTRVCTRTHRRIPSHVAVHVNIHLSFPHVHDQDSLVMDPESDEKMKGKNSLI
ncbi:Glutamate receptor, ionotropic kainate 2 [Trachymyrmex cornetzi]|uniref:Glutamate receptor, ionotropic kainate 2 n=1 Tax=Trachymyrmex cornetzi TaxID=471704 RepID=A0A151J8G9_9HYME|nr:Glutamate receptor, ionotropic kainate 2 [Trachymyrmex cornetzi]